MIKQVKVPKKTSECMPRHLMREMLDLAQNDTLWDTPNLVVSTIRNLRRIFDEGDSALMSAGDSEAVIDDKKVLSVLERAEKLRALHTWIADSRLSKSESTPLSYEFRAHTDNSIGNAVIALRDITQGEIVMSIPRKLMISAKFGYGPHPSIKASLLPKLASTPVLELAVVLVYHKINQDSSFFRPYLDILPADYAVPVFWDLEIFHILRFTPTGCRAANAFRAAVALYYQGYMIIEGLALPTFPAHKFTWKLFRWALSVVLTRQNNVPNPDTTTGSAEVDESTVEEVHCLIPGWDLMNHSALIEMTTHFDITQDSIIYPSAATVAAGQELLMCYGKRQNELFLLYGGFCLADNPCDGLELPIPIIQDDIRKVRDCIVRTLVATVRNASAANINSENEVSHDNSSVPTITHDENGSVSITLKRSDSGVLHDVMWFCALVGLAGRDEITAIMRSRITSYEQIVAAGMISDATKSLVKESIVKALHDYLQPLEAALGLLDQNSNVAATAESLMSEPTRRAVLYSCRNLLVGHADMIRSALSNCG